MEILLHYAHQKNRNELRAEIDKIIADLEEAV